MKTLELVPTLVLILTITAHADQPRTHLVAGVGEGLVVAFPDGGGVTWRPPATVFSLGVTLPIGTQWLWYTDVGMKTRNDVFNPAPQVVLGPGLKLTDRVALWFTAMYRYTPSYSRAPDSHITSLALAPSIVITPGVAVLFAVSGGVNISSGHVVPELGFGPKLSLVLW